MDMEQSLRHVYYLVRTTEHYYVPLRALATSLSISKCLTPDASLLSRSAPHASRLPPPASRPLLVQLSLEGGELGEHPREDIVRRQDGQACVEGAFLLTEPV